MQVFFLFTIYDIADSESILVVKMAFDLKMFSQQLQGCTEGSL